MAQQVITDIIKGGILHAVFQPIAQLRPGCVAGYEALIRGPSGTVFESPLALLVAAGREGCDEELEAAAAIECMRAFQRSGLPGDLYLNVSARRIKAVFERLDMRAAREVSGALPPARLVIELTEHNPVVDADEMIGAVNALRRTGVRFALDDYGTGHSNLDLWVRVRPEFVKLDKVFVTGATHDPFKLEVMKHLLRFAEISGAQAIAEGVEGLDDLGVVRDLGFPFAQGYFIERPSGAPGTRLSRQVSTILKSTQVAVLEQVTPVSPGRTVDSLLVMAPSVCVDDSNEHAFDVFTQVPDVHALAVLQGRVVVGLINRYRFMADYARPYYRELYRYRQCTTFAHRAPVIIERSRSIDSLVSELVEGDQCYLTDGIVITEAGRYAGLARGEDVVRALTELRVEAARHANPLTFLPGNVPLTMHIQRLLDRGTVFSACYVDLNHFKAFNDQYGYWRGDEVLKFAAATLRCACEHSRDFLGHIGGDDFLVLFQSRDWVMRSNAAIRLFNDGAQRFYDGKHRDARGMHGEDRNGKPAFFPLVTMAIGAVEICAHSAFDCEDISAVSAIAKRSAKKSDSGFAVLDLNNTTQRVSLSKTVT